MPIDRIPENAAFDPDAVNALTSAFEATCAALSLVDRNDPRTEIIAKKIMEHAQRGERDPIRLRELVVAEFQHGP